MKDSRMLEHTHRITFLIKSLSGAIKVELILSIGCAAVIKHQLRRKVFVSRAHKGIENLIKPIFDDAPFKESDDEADFIIYLHKARTKAADTKSSQMP